MQSEGVLIINTVDFAKEQIAIAIDALRKIGAIVDFYPENMKIKIISDQLNVNVEDDKLQILLDGQEVTKHVGAVFVKTIAGEYPDVRIAFKPKATIRRVKK